MSSSYPHKYDWVFTYQDRLDYQLKTNPPERMYYQTHKFKLSEVRFPKPEQLKGMDPKIAKQAIVNELNEELLN